MAGTSASQARLARNVSMGVILFGAVSLGMAFGSVIPILPAIAQHFGGGTRGALTAQLVFSIACIGMMSGGPLAGWLMMRIDPRLILLAALLIFSTAGTVGFRSIGRRHFFWRGFFSVLRLLPSIRRR